MRMWSQSATLCHYTVSQVKLTVFPVMREAQHGVVPWWIIVLSILLGLLLLGLLAFLLWKVRLKDTAPGHTHCLKLLNTLTVHPLSHYFNFTSNVYTIFLLIVKSVKQNLQNNKYTSKPFHTTNNVPLLSVESLEKRIKRSHQKKRHWRQMHKNRERG